MQLLFGDCLEQIKKIPDKSIDLVITDPPYKIENHGAGIYKSQDKKYVNDLEKMKNGFPLEMLEQLCRIMKYINIYIFCSQKQIIPLLQYFCVERKCNYNIISWHKANPIPACGNKYITDTEFILFFREKGVKLYGTYDTKHTYYVTPLNVKEKKLYKHPTVKPVYILENFVINSSLVGQTIFDPYMGSGSTGVAAIKNNRDFIGIEINGKYFDIAKKRIEDISNSV